MTTTTRDRDEAKYIEQAYGYDIWMEDETYQICWYDGGKLTPLDERPFLTLEEARDRAEQLYEEDACPCCGKTKKHGEDLFGAAEAWCGEKGCTWKGEGEGDSASFNV